jgi:hypothetical protein
LEDALRAHLIALAAAVGLAAFASQAAIAGPSADPGRDTCFMSSNWEGWKSPAPNVILIRVSLNQVYELDLSAGSSLLQDPDVHLVNKMWGGADYVCSPLDLQLYAVEDMGGMREGLIVKSIRRLTPAEIAAIPPKFRP